MWTPWAHFCVASPVTQTVEKQPAVQEMQVWSLDWEDPSEKRMAIHSSILAWKTPWIEEPGSQESRESQSRTQLSDYTAIATVITQYQHFDCKAVSHFLRLELSCEFGDWHLICSGWKVRQTTFPSVKCHKSRGYCREHLFLLWYFAEFYVKYCS